ncbi:hypothetical protein B0T22DRAFT_489779 [Podospora appendiculata]|uniref:Uncharacterized protein n=1 Tax=Podospora appendiculata TaxID=314037 RepID=A0AAE0X8Y5_9PEZI|nr:hypothetical protein B0T22DRAFT_489779 [Podospora appendiculata]
MAPGNFKIIDTSGKDGKPAVEFLKSRPVEAFTGCNGVHGRSAGSATAGTPGSDIRIRLVQVTGEGAHTGRLWKIDRDEQLLLKASGGEGGRGGRGENGQAGGPGQSGRDATKYRAGEDGQGGGRGGELELTRAGAAPAQAPDGADGASGGNVYLTVHDDDTDLLLPLAYNAQLTGCRNDGDESYSWPGGRNGDNGRAGKPAPRYLNAGRSAPHGSVQIKVIRSDLSEATYPGPYTLELVHFDVVDENHDGINDHVMEFGDGFLTLELLLADPRTGQMRPDPSVLLVVNASTPNHAIHQVIELLRHRLHTKLDIFNLGLTGSYESPVTKRNVLASYTGRTVVVFANDFTYFGGEVRNPWDLLDVWETAMLLKRGTSLLFANVAKASLQSLQAWATQATFPLPDSGGGDDDGQVESAKAAAKALRQAGPAAVATPSEEPWGWEVPVLRYPVSASLFRCIESAAVGSAAAAAKTLIKQMPLRRFVAFPEIDMKAEAGTGTVAVCSPRSATFGPSSPPNTNLNRITDYDMYVILSCLPFALRARMFWNAVGRLASESCEASVLYAGVEGYLDLPLPLPSAPDSLPLVVDDKVLQAVGLSLQFDLCDEIYCFTGTRPRFPDPIPEPEKLAQMPLTSLFFSLVPQHPQVTDVAQAQRLASALGAVHALANPLSFWQSVKAAFSWCGNRKGQLTAKLNEQILLAVDRACGAAPDVAAAVRQAVMQRSGQVKAGIRASHRGGGGHKNFDRFGQAEVAGFASVSGVVVHDLTALQPVSRSMNKTQVDRRRRSHWANQHMMGTLNTRAETQLKEMVNAEDDAGDTGGERGGVA